MTCPALPCPVLSFRWHSNHDWESGEIRTTLSPTQNISRRPRLRVTSNLTSNKEHFRLLAHSLDLVILCVVIHHIDRLLDIAKHQVAVAVIGLRGIKISMNELYKRQGGDSGSYVKSALQLAVTPELHKHNLIEQEAHEVEGFRDGRGLISIVCHLDAELWWCISDDRRDARSRVARAEGDALGVRRHLEAMAVVVLDVANLRKVENPCQPGHCSSSHPNPEGAQSRYVPYLPRVGR